MCGCVKVAAQFSREHGVRDAGAVDLWETISMQLHDRVAGLAEVVLTVKDAPVVAPKWYSYY